MHALVENTLVHLDPADTEGLADLRHRFDTVRRDFEAHRLEAEAARQRMRTYIDRKANPLPDSAAAECNDAALAAAESQDYAQDAILAAVVALEEAELATLDAILNKVEAQQSRSTK